MSLAERYDRGADKWTMVLDRLGFPAAYRGLFAELDLRVGSQDICDLGAGCGDFVAALAQVSGPVKSLTLVDPSRKMLARAENRLTPKCRELRSVAEKLESLPDIGQFDIVLGAHVLEHLADPEQGLRRVFQLLKPGGRLVLSVSKPHICQWLIWLKWQHAWFRRQHVTGWLHQTGFTAISVHRFPHGVPARCSHGYVAVRPFTN